MIPNLNITKKQTKLNKKVSHTVLMPAQNDQ